MPDFQNMTYSRLLESLSSYLERTDAAFTENRPQFIMLAENRLAVALKQQGFLSAVTGVFPLTNSMPKPAFWKETISFTYTNAEGQICPMYLRSTEYLKEYAPTAAPGAPLYYSDYNATHFRFAPVPEDTYAFELTYYARLQPLSEANQTNWMTLNLPQALLYATLLEGSLWKKSVADVAKWQAQYDAVAGAILTENQERLMDRMTVVSRG